MNNKMALCCLFLFVFVCFVRSLQENIILPSIKNTTQKYALIFFNGAYINNTQYISISKAIQNAFPMSLTVGLPGFIESLVDPKLIDHKISTLLNEMIQSNELPNNEILNVFMAGHSLGGAALQSWTFKNQYKYKEMYPEFNYVAQIQVGSCITKVYRDNNTQRLLNYSIPTITIGGEFDGLFRVSRLVEQYYCQLSGDYNTDSNIANYPVIYIPGMTHMQWASGTPPKHVYEYDLKPSISYDDAHTIGSQIISSYMQLQINGYQKDTTNFNIIKGYTNKTATFGEPFIKSLELESFHSFKLPCYCNNITCPSEPNCYGGNEFNTLYSESVLSGKAIDNTDSFHLIYDSKYYPTISTALTTTSVSQNIYALTDDTGFCPTASFEVRSKFISNQTIQYFNTGKILDITSTDTDNCYAINQYALSWARNNADPQILNRYYNESVSQQIRNFNDIVYDDELQWMAELLRYQQKTDETGHIYMQINSPSYITSINNTNGIGYHFCKLLSPARALEWIYIDSLRLKSSLSGNANIPIKCHNEN